MLSKYPHWLINTDLFMARLYNLRKLLERDILRHQVSLQKEHFWPSPTATVVLQQKKSKDICIAFCWKISVSIIHEIYQLSPHELWLIEVFPQALLLRFKTPNPPFILGWQASFQLIKQAQEEHSPPPFQKKIPPHSINSVHNQSWKFMKSHHI